MDLQYNKTDSVVLPITNTRISASEYNQIAASLMHIINTAGLTPDSADNTQLLNALKAIGSGWAMPSSAYDNLTLGASGSTYTAPANGYFVISKNANSNTSSGDFKYIEVKNTTSGVGFLIPGNYGFSLEMTVPAQKGDIVSVTYNANGKTNFFQFIYAEGSKSEAN